jgi:hypothetical protein
MRRIVMSLTLALALAAVPLSAQAPAKKAPARQAPTNGTMRITGNASSLVSCTQGSAYAVHNLGASVRGTQITVDLTGNDGFDGMATAVVIAMGGSVGDDARVQYAYSDDADGLDPRLNINLERDATVIVLVGSYSGEPGCYFLKTDVRVP